MDEKVKILWLDNDMREMAEKLGIDKKKSEILLREIKEAMDDPEANKGVLRALDLLLKGDMQTFRKEWKEDMEKLKELEKTPIGIQDEEGKFICGGCMEGKYYYEDEIITMSDFYELKPGSFFQCHNCNIKFSKEGITK